MKTISINLYTWDELSEKAKRHYWETSGLDFSDDYGSDYENTLNSFCNAFDVSCFGWSVNDYTFHFSSETAGRWDDCPDSPEKAARWIPKILWNEYRDRIYKGKYFSTPGHWNTGKYSYKCRYSHVIMETDCTLTGYCADDFIMQPLLDCLNGKETYTSPAELFDACFTAFFEAWQTDIIYCSSFEHFDEIMTENYPDAYFTESGDKYE